MQWVPAGILAANLFVRLIHLMEQSFEHVEWVLDREAGSCALVARELALVTLLHHISQDKHVRRSLQVLNAQADHQDGAKGGSPIVLGPRPDHLLKPFENFKHDLPMQFMHGELDLTVQESAGEVYRRRLRGLEIEFLLYLHGRLLGECGQGAHEVMECVELHYISKKLRLSDISNANLGLASN